jgi:arylsulfatase A-like enzyme
VDEQIGELLRAWARRPGGARASASDGADRADLIALTADHGEGLFEHDYQGHGFFLYEEQLAVPLVLCMRGAVPPGARVTRVTSTVDLPATLCELADVTPPAGLGGRSLMRFVRTGGVDPDEERSDPMGFAFAERRRYDEGDLDAKAWLLRNADGGEGSGTGELVALVHGRWKAIWSENGPFELYDLETDPDELVNRTESEPERAAEMRARIERWREDAGAVGVSTSNADAEVESMLDDLGY